MLKKLAFAAFFLSLVGGTSAQEAENEQPRREPATTHKVLQNPYDIASFYRSSQGQSYFGYAGEDALASRYRRSIGQNGDLFLFAPVFLAPIGPLAGAFGY
jgi:hypothetical protein